MQETGKLSKHLELLSEMIAANQNLGAQLKRGGRNADSCQEAAIAAYTELKKRYDLASAPLSPQLPEFIANLPERLCTDGVVVTKSALFRYPCYFSAALEHTYHFLRCFREIYLNLLQAESESRNKKKLDADQWNDCLERLRAYGYSQNDFNAADCLRGAYHEALIINCRLGFDEDASSFRKGEPAPNRLLSHAPDFSSFWLEGCEYIPTRKQRAAIRLLWEGAAKGRPDVQDCDIIDAAESSADRWDSVFSSRKEILRLIVRSTDEAGKSRQGLLHLRFHKKIWELQKKRK
ncbi:MAG: hypothetical protein Aurels2KO_21960 [Aureliella sp.]